MNLRSPDPARIRLILPTIRRTPCGTLGSLCTQIRAQTLRLQTAWSWRQSESGFKMKIPVKESLTLGCSAMVAVEENAGSSPSQHLEDRSIMLKRTAITLISCLVLATLAPLRSSADDLFIYPAKAQSPAQQDKDKWECRAWATNQTGFDPAVRPTATTPPPMRQAPQGGLLRGAAGGAAVGAVGGAIAGNAGKGAAIGAAGGGMLGVMRRNNQIRQEDYSHQQWAQQNVAQYEQKRAGWVRAVRACLTGRGYTVQ